MAVKVKICGLTDAEDARAAVMAGADALGFMFFRASPRFVTSEQAVAIIGALPPFVAKVGVFVNASAEEVKRAISISGVDTLQFHGDETPEFCRQFGLKVLKAFRVRDEGSLKLLPPFSEETWLLDSHVSGQLGGTGATFNWDLAVAASQLGRPIILAGGLTPENAAAAVRQVRPYALDVSSGVESAPGRKDAGKMRAFIAAAKGAS